MSVHDELGNPVANASIDAHEVAHDAQDHYAAGPLHPAHLDLALLTVDAKNGQEELPPPLPLSRRIKALRAGSEVALDSVAAGFFCSTSFWGGVDTSAERRGRISLAGEVVRGSADGTRRS